MRILWRLSATSSPLPLAEAEQHKALWLSRWSYCSASKIIELSALNCVIFRDRKPCLATSNLVVGVLLHHLPEEGEARHLDHLSHRQQHLWNREARGLFLLAANYTLYLVLYLENFLVPHIFLSHVRNGSRNIIVGLGFVFSPCPNGPKPLQLSSCTHGTLE